MRGKNSLLPRDTRSKLGMIIALARYFFPGDKATKMGQWEMRNKFPAVDLEGKTLGLIGAGRVGSLVAKKAFYGLNMKILAYDPYIDDPYGPACGYGN